MVGSEGAGLARERAHIGHAWPDVGTANRSIGAIGGGPSAKGSLPATRSATRRLLTAEWGWGVSIGMEPPGSHGRGSSVVPVPPDQPAVDGTAAAAGQIVGDCRRDPVSRRPTRARDGSRTRRRRLYPTTPRRSRRQVRWPVTPRRPHASPRSPDPWPERRPDDGRAGSRLRDARRHRPRGTGATGRATTAPSPPVGAALRRRGPRRTRRPTQRRPTGSTRCHRPGPRRPGSARRRSPAWRAPVRPGCPPDAGSSGRSPARPVRPAPGGGRGRPRRRRRSGAGAPARP